MQINEPRKIEHETQTSVILREVITHRVITHRKRRTYRFYNPSKRVPYVYIRTQLIEFKLIDMFYIDFALR